MSEETNPKSRRGFASMTLERRREIAARGGANVPKESRHFFKHRELAVEAGRKGGAVSRRTKVAREPEQAND